MADLKACLETMGLKDLKTLLQSGNILFESSKSAPELKREIEQALTKTFSYAAKVQVYEISKLQRIIKANPIGESDATHQSYVVFFENGLERDLAAEATNLNPKIETIKVGDGVIYWRVLKGMTLKSEFGKKYLVKPKYRDFHTNRNLNTVRKIVA